MRTELCLDIPARQPHAGEQVPHRAPSDHDYGHNVPSQSHKAFPIYIYREGKSHKKGLTVSSTSPHPLHIAVRETPIPFQWAQRHC